MTDAPDALAPSILTRLQRGLESMYRVETRLEVDAFVIDEEQRQQTASPAARAPREQLLVSELGDDLGLALFVDAAALANLKANDPAAGLHDGNFGDFCLALEGVSHFVYVALCAARDRRVSALELELQAEVDKFACCVLLAGRHPGLRRRLFSTIRYADDLDATERDRYRTANDEANRYAEALDRRFVQPDRLTAMLTDLRQFYRLDLDAKRAHITRTAAG